MGSSSHAAPRRLPPGTQLSTIRPSSSRLKQNGPSRGSGEVSTHTLPHPTVAAFGAGAATGAEPRLGGGGVRPEVAGCGF